MSDIQIIFRIEILPKFHYSLVSELSMSILSKNLSNFVPPVWKLHNPYCHIDEQSCFFAKEKGSSSSFSMPGITFPNGRNIYFQNKFVLVHCAKHSTRCWAFFMVLLAEKRATKRREVAVATVNWQNSQKESLEFALFSPTTVFFSLSYVQLQSSSYKVLRWALFYQTESEIWAGLGQLSSLKLVNMNIVFLNKRSKITL